jgi:hypothetical protein
MRGNVSLPWNVLQCCMHCVRALTAAWVFAVVLIVLLHCSGGQDPQSDQSSHEEPGNVTCENIAYGHSSLQAGHHQNEDEEHPEKAVEPHTEENSWMDVYRVSAAQRCALPEKPTIYVIFSIKTKLFDHSLNTAGACMGPRQSRDACFQSKVKTGFESPRLHSSFQRFLE